MSICLASRVGLGGSQQPELSLVNCQRPPGEGGGGGRGGGWSKLWTGTPARAPSVLSCCQFLQQPTADGKYVELCCP